MQPVIQWQQNECHGKIADEVPDNYLKIVEPDLIDSTGNGNECHPRKRSADHTEDNHPPFAAAIADKE
jgi:hypothetical protein